jgi:transposase
VGKKRVRVEALLAAAAAAVPPPAADLVPDPTLADDLMPEDLPRLLGLLARADLYLQDEVEVGLHPTLTRVWSRAGRPGQRLVQAPGKNFKRCGFGLVDWRDGHLDFELAEGRRAAPLCAQLRRAVARSRQRGRIAMVILDNLGIHTPKGSRLLRALLEELGEDLVLVYTPTYDPDANRIEWLWRALRRTVTHTHQRQRLQDLLADADRWARTIPAAKVLSQIGSPFALDQRLAVETAKVPTGAARSGPRGRGSAGPRSARRLGRGQGRPGQDRHVAALQDAATPRAHVLLDDAAAAAGVLGEARRPR